MYGPSKFTAKSAASPPAVCWLPYASTAWTWNDTGTPARDSLVSSRLKLSGSSYTKVLATLGTSACTYVLCPAYWVSIAPFTYANTR